MKILEIQSCEECFNKKSCGNHWFCGVTNSNIFGSTIPDWCPLPDRHLTPAAPDSEGRCVKCGFWYSNGFEFCADCGKVLRCP
ncbi:hypothetical protein KAR91_74885 [Candidatus Pacearchaeota archaeon]|nr:hypothetical protein [Candidatus Pacearchaeota archaeon]